MATSDQLMKLAGVLYTAFRQEVGGVVIDGDAWPSWDKLCASPSKQKQVNGWVNVAKAATRLSYTSILETHQYWRDTIDRIATLELDKMEHGSSETTTTNRKETNG